MKRTVRRWFWRLLPLAVGALVGACLTPAGARAFQGLGQVILIASDGTALATDASHNLKTAPATAIPTGANTIGAVNQGTGGSSAWKVDGSGVTQPVSGTGNFTVTQGTASNLKVDPSGVTSPVSLSDLPATERHVGEVGGNTAIVTDTFARPADTTAYTAGDAVSATVSDTGTTVLRGLAVARVNQGSGYLTGIRLWTDQKTNTARFRVHLYTVAAPASAVVGDNVPMQILWSNFAQRLGTIDLAAMATETDSSGSTAAHTADFTIRIPFVCASSDNKVYYRLQTLDAFTPASGQNFGLALGAERN